MKAIMYHYVRPGSLGWDRLKYLHLDNFRRQLDWFARNGGFVSRRDFLESIADGKPRDGVILTFDDGLADHYRYVFPELVARDLWGIFYVSTGVYLNRQLLDVHRVHLLTARCGGTACLAAAQEVVTDKMLAKEHVSEFRNRTYDQIDEDGDAIEFKYLFNYYLAYEYREEMLARVVGRLRLNLPDSSDFYVSPDELVRMSKAEMEIGSHGINHLVMSRIDRDRQRQEIEGSFQYLGRAVGVRVDTFCYPYGGFHSFTGVTESLLTEAGCRYAFNVEPRDISSADLQSRPQALPRYDCNRFPFGFAGLPEKIVETGVI